MKKLGVRIVRDVNYKMLGYYRQKLAEAQMNRPPDMAEVHRLEALIKDYEGNIERNHRRAKKTESLVDLDKLDKVDRYFLERVKRKAARGKTLRKSEIAYLKRIAGVQLTNGD